MPLDVSLLFRAFSCGRLLVFSETLYWFGDNNHTEWKDLFESYEQPPYKLPGLTGAYSFGVAGKLFTVILTSFFSFLNIFFFGL